MQWKLTENYWVLLHNQLSPEWHKSRIGILNISKLEACLGKSIFSNPQEAAMDIIGLKNKKITTVMSQVAMNHSLIKENEARNIYSKINNVSVEQLGLIKPIWDLNLGYSPDGLIGTEGLVEFKCPIKMYDSLKNLELIKSKLSENCYYHEHINMSHYYQMQGGMAITKRNWCDYFVYCKNDNVAYQERILFNKEEWDKETYPQILIFIKDILEPLREKYNIYPIIPSL